MCTHPTKSRQACLFAGSRDCEGYPESEPKGVLHECDCGFFGLRGCKITSPAPPGYACRCYYNGLLACFGRIKGCTDRKSEFCKKPDLSKASCRLARLGNCRGYSNSA